MIHNTKLMENTYCVNGQKMSMMVLFTDFFPKSYGRQAGIGFKETTEVRWIVKI